ncbi:MAG: ABC transporter substrate-binding protein [Armatimonadota bacterium]
MNVSIRRALLHVAAVALIAILVGGVGSAVYGQRPRKRLVWASALATGCLDPALSNRLPDWNNTMNIYSQLVTHKPGTLTEVAPDLAERWTVSQDGTVYTFFLRAGVKWHEGFGELSAQDVKYSWERILDPNTRAVSNTDLRPVKSIDVVDPRTVRVTLDAPSPGWLTSVANSAFTAIVNRRAVEERGASHCIRPIGTGPYRVVRAEPRGGVVLAAHEEYFGSRPPIDDVEFRVIPEEAVSVLALRSGDIDMMIVREYANIALLGRVANVAVNADAKSASSTYMLWLNNTRKPFTDVRVRRAMIHALDRKTMVVKVTETLSTRVAHSAVPPTLFGFTEDIPKYEFDRARARQLLREAGFPNGFKTSVIALNTAYHPAAVTIAQAMWKQVGVDVEINLMDQPAIRPRQRTGDFDITISDPTNAEVSQTLQWFDPRNVPGQNLALYKGRGLDRLIDAQARETDPQKRAAILKRIQQQIASDAPGVPLWNTIQVTAARTNVKGLIPNMAWWQTRFWLMDIDR